MKNAMYILTIISAIIGGIIFFNADGAPQQCAAMGFAVFPYVISKSYDNMNNFKEDSYEFYEKVIKLLINYYFRFE